METLYREDHSMWGVLSRKELEHQLELEGINDAHRVITNVGWPTGEYTHCEITCKTADYLQAVKVALGHIEDMIKLTKRITALAKYLAESEDGS